MGTIRFSYIDYVTSGELISLLKRIAKQLKTLSVAGKGLATHQDEIAHSLNYKNWSMLHKHLDGLHGPAFQLAMNQVLRHKQLGPAVKELAFRTIDEDEAVQTMKSWARRKYSRLIDFAYYDNEAENGFSWPEVDMADELSAEFCGQFPDNLIQEVGNALDTDEGPWGLEEYGDD
jgi:hypothetical protein